MRKAVITVLLLAAVAVIVMVLYSGRSDAKTETKYYEDYGLYVPGLDPVFSGELKKKPKDKKYIEVKYDACAVKCVRSMGLADKVFREWKYSYDDKGRLETTIAHLNTRIPRGDKSIWTYKAQEFNERGLPTKLAFELRYLDASGRDVGTDRKTLEYLYDDKGRFSACRATDATGEVESIVKVTYNKEGGIYDISRFDAKGNLLRSSRKWYKELGIPPPGKNIEWGGELDPDGATAETFQKLNRGELINIPR